MVKSTPQDKDPAYRPADVDRAIWDTFIAKRTQQKKPFTVRDLHILQRQCVKASVSVSDALSEAVARGWSGWGLTWRRENLGPPEPPRKNYDPASKTHIPKTPIGNRFCRCAACGAKRGNL